MENLLGSLLVANGNLMDPNFRRTVVVITDHSEGGAMGLVLNRPAPLTVEETAPALTGLVSVGSPLFLGGPVQPEAVIVLAEFNSFDLESRIVVGSIGLLSQHHDRTADGIKRARVFAGYAGWGPGQLEAEADQDAWIIEDALPGDIFTEHPERLWSQVLQRKGGDYRLLALMPLDPSTN
ncbi:MAG: YqgE/AlgH family protein [Actinomycetota bacterium]